jgi:hypothetical protein
LDPYRDAFFWGGNLNSKISPQNQPRFQTAVSSVRSLDMPSCPQKWQSCPQKWQSCPQKWQSCPQVRYNGSGLHMGIRGKWSLTFRPDGAFYSEFRSKHLDIISGHDGGQDSRCWEVTPSPLPLPLFPIFMTKKVQ